MSRIWDLLKRFQGVAKPVNLRLAIVAVVLGVGGFTVYKGVQQLQSAKPTPKRIGAQKTEEELAAEGAQAGALQPGTEQTPEAQLTSGQFQASTEAPLYGGGAGGTQEAPVYGGDSSSQYAEGAAGEGGGTQEEPAATYGARQEAGQYEQDTAVGQNTAGTDSNRRRPSTRAPVAGAYSVTDESAAETEQPAAVEADSATQPLEGALVEEVPNEAAEEPSASNPRFPGTRAPAPLTSIRPAGPSPAFRGSSGTQIEPVEPAEPQPLQHNTFPVHSATPLSGQRGGRLNATPASLSQRSGQSVPGERQLEGMQAPSVALEKLAPAEVQVGKLATFETRVRNVGQIAAHDVVVTDHVPRGTRLEATTPQATQAADGTLTWNLGAMQPGDEIAISMQVTPEAEGEIGSVAQVGFAGKATARTISTRPLLNIEHTAPKQVMIGQEVRLQVTVSNPGSGAATGVIVEEDVPDGLSHVAGNELEYEIGILRPGESRQMELSLKAEKPGLLENTIIVRGEGNLTARHSARIEVISPQLQVGVNGPKKKYLDQQAAYTLTVANPGTAAARDVQLVAYLPKGMKFVTSDSEGQYDAGQHAVFWNLEELPASKSGNVKLTAIPFETGEQRMRVEGRADLGLNVASEQIMQVDAVPELVFTISDLADPIEVGANTTYEVTVTNKGSGAATNVGLAASLPNDIKLLSGEGPSRATTKGQQVSFEPIGRINPGEEMIFRINAQGVRPGDHHITVQLSCAEAPTPVRKEESTQVYVDR